MTDTEAPQRAPSGRATSVAGMRAIQKGMITPDGIGAGMQLQLRPTDVVITPFGKCGTTWLQQMAHCLRTRGDMDFDDISRVTPWIETSTDLGLDLNAEQKANPRVFKSHLDAISTPKGGRYINSCRDPKDAVYSMFKFMEGWFIEPGSVTLDQFARDTYLSGNPPGNPRGDYWSHLKSWWVRRNDPDVLFMAYEHMKGGLEGTIRRVAIFMEIALDEELLAITLEHSSLPFMKAHSDRFDDKLMRERSVAVCGLPENNDSSKVRSGQVGESRKQLGDDISAAFDAMWQEQITAEFGFPDYASMIAVLD